MRIALKAVIARTQGRNSIAPLAASMHRQSGKSPNQFILESMSYILKIALG